MLEIEQIFDQIKNMKNLNFQKIVKSKMEKRAHAYLINKIKSKGKGIDYGDCFKMQPYLMPNRILTLEDQIDIFSYRARMNNLKYNTKGTSEIEYCLCSQEITNEHLLCCNLLNKDKPHFYTYDEFLNGCLIKKKHIINILRNNMIKHLEFSQDQDKIP